MLSTRVTQFRPAMGDINVRGTVRSPLCGYVNLLKEVPSICCFRAMRIRNSSLQRLMSVTAAGRQFILGRVAGGLATVRQTTHSLAGHRRLPIVQATLFPLPARLGPHPARRADGPHAQRGAGRMRCGSRNV